jgi:hypothetical protein
MSGSSDKVAGGLRGHTFCYLYRARPINHAEGIRLDGQSLQKITLPWRTLDRERRNKNSPTPGSEPMRNTTVKISDDSYRDARVWAARRDTSKSAVMLCLMQSLPTIMRPARAFFDAHKLLVSNGLAPAPLAD